MQPKSASAGQSISIHAPARGATYAMYDTLQTITHFNPRSRTGSDKVIPAMVPVVVISIHAPARGATANLNKFDM